MGELTRQHYLTKAELAERTGYKQRPAQRSAFLYGFLRFVRWILETHGGDSPNTIGDVKY